MPKSSPVVALGLGFISLLSVSSAQAQILAQWSFDGSNTPVGVNNTPAPSTGTGTADAIGFTNSYNSTTSTNTDDVVLGVTSGSKSDTGVNGVADGTQVWRIRGQSPGNGWSSSAPIATQGAQFFTSTSGITSGSIKVSFDWYSTTQGEANLQLLYTTNGGTTWKNLTITPSGSDAGLQILTNTTSANTVLGSYASDNLANNAQAGQDWFTGLTATITDAAALNKAGFGIEMVNASTGTDNVSTQGTALNNTSGNWRFDNISIQALSAPEPSAFALGLLAVIGLAGLHVGRRIRA